MKFIRKKWQFWQWSWGSSYFTKLKPISWGKNRCRNDFTWEWCTLQSFRTCQKVFWRLLLSAFWKAFRRRASCLLLCCCFRCCTRCVPISSWPPSKISFYHFDFRLSSFLSVQKYNFILTFAQNTIWLFLGIRIRLDLAIRQTRSSMAFNRPVTVFFGMLKTVRILLF